MICDIMTCSLQLYLNKATCFNEGLWESMRMSESKRPTDEKLTVENYRVYQTVYELTKKVGMAVPELFSF